jgi:glycosyltransferase involved in cell wall biosynthesis
MKSEGSPRPAVIIVTFSYHPVCNARSFRWTAIAGELARRGWRVVVVTAWRPGLSREEARDGVEIRRVGSPWLEALRAQAGGLRTRGDGAPARSGSLSGFILRAGVRAWQALAWPDTSCTWYRPALAALDAVRLRTPGAVLVSVTPSFTAAIVALRLARRDPSLRWILDMGDPFSLAVESPPNNFRIHAGLNRWAERAIARRADAVAFTNETMLARHCAEFGLDPRRAVCIPPLLDPSMDGAAPARRGCEAASPLTLVYVGTLYRSLRRPDFLLELFARLSMLPDLPSLELHFYGDVGECAGSFVPYLEAGHRVLLHGTVPRATALAAVREAGILVDLGNRNAAQLPSKLVEYLASGRPIIELSGARDAAARSLLQGQPGVLVLEAVGAPDEAAVRSVAQFIARMQTEGPVSRDAGSLAPFRLGAVVDRYEALLGTAAGAAVVRPPGAQR